jgi:SseB protein N-terminal domain
MTRLDDSCAAMMQDDEDHAARLNFYSQLADTELFLMLDADAIADQVQPRIFDLDEGPVVLAFDLEERLSAFVGGPAPYAALPGRVIAAQLAGQGVGLGLNVGDAPSSIILPPEAMDWLTNTLDTKPQQVAAVAQGFSSPWGIPASVTDRLMEKLSTNAGLAEAVLLAEVVYEGGRRGHILAVLGAVAGAEAALSGAVSEALVFSGLDLAEMDVVFLAADDPRTAIIEGVALRLDLPKLMAPTKPAPRIPGMDPSKPPILR